MGSVAIQNVLEVAGQYILRFQKREKHFLKTVPADQDIDGQKIVGIRNDLVRGIVFPKAEISGTEVVFLLVADMDAGAGEDVENFDKIVRVVLAWQVTAVLIHRNIRTAEKVILTQNIWLLLFGQKLIVFILF